MEMRDLGLEQSDLLELSPLKAWIVVKAQVKAVWAQAMYTQDQGSIHGVLAETEGATERA